VEIVVPNFNDSIITWTTAAHNARNSGGELASINSFEEFEKITAEADANGLIFLWIGAKRNESQLWEDAKWLDGTKMEFTKWLDKEPSYESDGEQECYLMLIKVGEEWYFNDTSNDITKFYNSEYYFSKSGYAVERVK
jgi:hypothetical protein